MSATAGPTTLTAAPSILPYAGTIFLSAFLLFLVQPIIAKQILPWFGGSAAVWTTCLVFFQTTLLAGYAYADITHRLGLRRQTVLHIALLGLSLLAVPILASETWKPRGDEDPILRILLLLTATIGLPYFLLSTTTPLLQAWYVRRFHAAVPYRLFALSNFASLLALLGFPVLLEPSLSLPQLGWSWSMVYAIFVLVCAATAWISLRTVGKAGEVGAASVVDPQYNAVLPPAFTAQLLWLALSAMGSVMLLGVTNHVTQNVASVPFLWVVPLSLYLITFILCFDHPRWYVRWVFIGLLIPGVPLMAWMIPSLSLKVAGPLFFAGLFVVCMFCHGELARLKPHPKYLTRFYLMLSLGGALGAVLVAIIAPQTLSGYFELNIALVLLALLVMARLPGITRAIGVVVSVATAWFAFDGAREYSRDMRMIERDFYGVVRTRDSVVDGVKYRSMYHGGIVHGGQLQGEEFKRQASDYFGPTSGYGRMFAAMNEVAPGPRKVGVIGLGAGVIAAYGRAGDSMTFYEISGTVVDVEKKEFTFLRETPAATRVILGDGRLSLEREQPNGYQVLGVDAFSGDSIPMHLITREAMAQYVRHLAPDGVIVFQATNRYVNLMPVIKRLATEVGMEAVLISDFPSDSRGAGYWLSATDQVLVTRNQALLTHEKLIDIAEPIEDQLRLPTFTDAHHNMFRILK